jgi:hypothetical protein
MLRAEEIRKLLGKVTADRRLDPGTGLVDRTDVVADAGGGFRIAPAQVATAGQLEPQCRASKLHVALGTSTH